MSYNRLKIVLEEKGVSQTELSEMLDTSKSAINAMCANKRQPSMARLYGIASALNIPAYTLIADYNPETVRAEIAKSMLSQYVEGVPPEQASDESGEKTEQ